MSSALASADLGTLMAAPTLACMWILYSSWSLLTFGIGTTPKSHSVERMSATSLKLPIRKRALSSVSAFTVQCSRASVEVLILSTSIMPFSSAQRVLMLSMML